MDVIGVALTALIGTAVARLTNTGIDVAASRLPRAHTVNYVPRRLELSATPLTDAVLRHSEAIKVDGRWQLANDAFRRTSQSGVRKAGREDLLREASYNFNWIRRNELPGSLPQVHSALMYALTTSLLGEHVEALRAVQESLSGQFIGKSLYLDAVEVAGSGRKYDGTNARLKIMMHWLPPTTSGYSGQAFKLNGPTMPLRLTGSDVFLAQDDDPRRSPLLTLVGVTSPGRSYMSSLAPAGSGVSYPYAADIGRLVRREAPWNDYQRSVLAALSNISPFSAIEASEGGAADAWIEAGLPRLLPVYMDSSENERSRDQMIDKLKPFSFERALFITDGNRFYKGIQQLDGKLVMSLFWRQGEGNYPIVAAIRKLVASLFPRQPANPHLYSYLLGGCPLMPRRGAA